MYKCFKFVNNTKAVETSKSMMKFNEYYIGFIREPQSQNGWGWFVDIEFLDIESSVKPIRKLNPYRNYKQSQHVREQKTIKEVSSIRSMKSMRDLQDTSMIFKMDDDDNKDRNNGYIFNIYNVLGLIGITIFILLHCKY